MDFAVKADTGYYIIFGCVVVFYIMLLIKFLGKAYLEQGIGLHTLSLKMIESWKYDNFLNWAKKCRIDVEGTII